MPNVTALKKPNSSRSSSSSLNQQPTCVAKHNLSDENNNEDHLNDNNESNSRLVPLRNNRQKALRMLSSPAQSVEIEENTQQEMNDQALLSRNFLIDNMTDYYNNFIKKDIKIEDLRKGSRGSLESDIKNICQESGYEDLDKKESRFDKLFRLKRSKSLEINTTTSSSLDLADNNKGRNLELLLLWTDSTYKLIFFRRRFQQSIQNHQRLTQLQAQVQPSESQTLPARVQRALHLQQTEEDQAIQGEPQTLRPQNLKIPGLQLQLRPVRPRTLQRST